MEQVLQFIATGGDTANIIIAFFLWNQHTRLNKLENAVFKGHF